MYDQFAFYSFHNNGNGFQGFINSVEKLPVALGTGDYTQEMSPTRSITIGFTSAKRGGYKSYEPVGTR
jgi:hypothetical protein